MFFLCKCHYLQITADVSRISKSAQRDISFILNVLLETVNARLTHLMPVLSSYRNQSIHLHSKSIDWFLYEGNTGI